MHSFVRNFITEWRRLDLPFTGETVIVAVSGGADSVSLLLALHELKKSAKLELRLVAAHLNHQLRGAESDADEDFVRHLTTNLKIELALHREHISHEGNLEQNARITRYRFLGETAKSLHAFAVLTGHTVNDQAETFLLNLIRGSGIDGLSGMKVIRELEGEKRRRGERETLERRNAEKNDVDKSAGTGNSPFLPFSPSPFLPSSPLLIRPLLTWAKRSDTEAFCHDLGVEYRYDTMNEDTALKRVRIRKVLLPLLEDFNPKIVETLANTAELLSLQTENTVVDSGNSKPEISLRELKSLPRGELYERLRNWLGHQRGTMRTVGLKHIEAIERLVFSTKSGKTVELPGGATVVKSDGELVFKKFGVEK